MNEIEAAWLAGLLDGEGYFCYQGTPWVRLSMTDKDVVERAAAVMDTHCHPMAWRKHRTKQDFRANVCGGRAIYVMNRILPYMGKRRSAKIREVLALAAARPGGVWGERAGASKLTDAQAKEIVRRFAKGAKASDENSSLSLAKEFGISRTAVYYVLNTRRTSDGSALRP